MSQVLSLWRKCTSIPLVGAETDAAQWTSADPNLPVQVRSTMADGTVVIEGVINLWVTEKRADLKAAAAS